MKIFMSFCSEDKELGAFLATKFSEEAHQTFSTAAIDQGEDISTSINRMLSEADAFITIVSRGSKNSKWQQLEWRTALEISWNKPDLTIIGIVNGRINPPSFLLSRPIVRITKEKSQEAIAAEVLKHLTHKENTAHSSHVKLNNMLKKGMNKISSEIDKFRLTDAELEEEKKWLQKQIDNVILVDPTSIEIANLQIKLSDILMNTGSKQEVVDALQKGLDILDQNGEVTALNKAKVQEKLALALERLGNYEKAIEHICGAMNAFGANLEPRQVQNQLLQCQANIPEYVTQLTDTLRTASHETATYGRRFLATLQQIDESMKKSKSVEKIGGES